MMNLPALIGTFFALFCLWLLRHALADLHKADNSMGWPKVTGQMLKVNLWGTRNIDGEMKPVDKLSVEYEYDVDGKRHSSTRVAFYTLVYPETVQFAEKHPEQHEVEVFYSPKDPSEAVLLRGAKAENKRYSDVILASLGLLIGVAIALGGIMGYLG